MRVLVVCDLSWLMYRSYYSYPISRFYYQDGDGIYKPNGHVFGVLRSIVELRKKFPNSDIVLCKDGVPKDRIELLGGSVEEGSDGKLKITRGEYKEGRGNIPYNLHTDSDTICNLCSSLPGVYYAYDKFKESDDLMYALAKNNKNRYDKIYVYSGDNDLLQTIDDNIFVIRSLAKDAIILDDYWVQMVSDYRVPAKKLPIFRSMRGDVSDTIEGIYPRLSKDFARHVATNFDSIEEIEWFTPPAQDPFIKWWERIQNPKSFKLLERNYKLMKLNAFPVGTIKTKMTHDEVISKLELMRLNSFIKVFTYAWRNDG